MAYVTVIAMLALIEYLYFGIQVGAARGRAGIEARGFVLSEASSVLPYAPRLTRDPLLAGSAE